MTALALFFAVAAFAALALATDAHHGRWLHARPSPVRKRRLRAGGWIALAASFALAVAGRGWVQGPVVWTGLIMLAAGVVFLFLNLGRQPHAKRTRR
jgi:di/tricarboxylate transporter